MRAIRNVDVNLVKRNQMIFGNGIYYDYDSNNDRCNDIALVVGSSGSGKTTSIVKPNIEQCYGSYVVVDPKGNLHGQLREQLIAEGYHVKWLNFIKPELSHRYDPLHYVETTQDIIKIAHMLVHNGTEKAINKDPYWTDIAEILLCAIIGYIYENYTLLSSLQFDTPKVGVPAILEYLSYANEPYKGEITVLDSMFNKLEKRSKNSWAVKQYRLARAKAEKTWTSITTTLASKFRGFGSDEMADLLAEDEMDITKIGHEKTVVFVTVSDTDRSMDVLANLFYSQAMNILCEHADYDESCPGQKLPVPVQFIFDDFATNCLVEEMPRMISAVRSRGISIMMMIQAESQLFNYFKDDARTIIANADTYVYLGTNEPNTMDSVAKRADIMKKRIYEMPVGKCIIFRKGQEAFMTDTFEFMNWDRSAKLKENAKFLKEAKPELFKAYTKKKKVRKPADDDVDRDIRDELERDIETDKYLEDIFV